MPWIQVRYTTDKESADAISDHMTGTGAAAVTFLDAADTPIYEPMPGEFLLWEATTVVGLYDAEVDVDKILLRLQASNAGSKGFYKVEQLEDKDWVREWMDSFHPMQFGERLWICPSWRDVPDEQAVNVLLDPGLAFGTGTHPTTGLCLQWLDSHIQDDQVVVDFGCGSGILAIAALKLGAQRVVGIDIDPQAIEASKENAKRNQVEDKIELFLPNNQPNLQADVVVANILAGPLRELAQVITDYVKPGGKLALSGILASQAEQICEIYAQWFDLDPVAQQEDWCRVSGTKR
ncbi:50S ribosomal protein L11 methyltransferase [Saccharobesus litoralis]|uniref:Ribosomal protein L11 methyltransferase n=1 Tax=Saccharobesus litoralis TaxID=2172099 RepID=A0A2S0VND4_9ALTE|nr:50S ribosomal protein L11 methyltransferase [Saccharobesus litoralis]AWB65734.1 50S ribosomal protein L11 methyltransferase [Saccharobesus litoralis]